MANLLSLEERTIGFFLKSTNNVTSYGPILEERKWIIPLLSMPEDYDFLRQAQNSQLEHPTEPAYIHFVQRNPFLGVRGEQAFAIHQVLKMATEKAPYFLSQGLVSYAQSPRGGYFSFFLELAERWYVGEVVKKEFESSVNKMKRRLIFV